MKILSLPTLLLCFLVSAQKPKVESVNPELDSFSSVRDFCLSDDGTEMYFSVQSPGSEISRIACLVRTGTTWSKPLLMPFSGKFYDLEPVLSPDQTRLYFVSNRPLQGLDGPEKDMDIWYVERKEIRGKWSDPINMGSPVNSSGDEFYPSLASNGNLYFTTENPAGMGKDDIWFCQWNGKSYEAPVLLDGGVNSAGLEFNAFVSRNEDVLLFTKYNSPGGLGSGDLYISKKDKDGKWQPAMSLGIPINTKYMEYCPFYHERTGMLYFTSRRNEMKAMEKYADLEALRNVVNGSANGQSRIYKVAFRP